MEFQKKTVRKMTNNKFRNWINAEKKSECGSSLFQTFEVTVAIAEMKKGMASGPYNVAADYLHYE